jgi:hypothetical protein
LLLKKGEILMSERNIQNIIIGINLLILPSLIPVAGTVCVSWVYFFTALLSLIAISLHWYKNIIFDRVMLSLYVYLLIKAAIITRLDFIGELSGSWDVIKHKHFIFPVLIAIGTYTTFLTEPGFIGIVGVDPKSVRRASLTLLIIAIIMWFNAWDARWPGQIAAFLFVGWADGVLGRKLLNAQLDKERGKEVRDEKSDWSFKW